MQVDRSQMTQEWLQTPLGEALLQQEARVVEEALDGVFGEQCLQLGLWGENRAFLRFTRTQRCSVIAESGAASPAPSAICTGCRSTAIPSMRFCCRTRWISATGRMRSCARWTACCARWPYHHSGLQARRPVGSAPTDPGRGHAAGRGSPDLGPAPERLAASCSICAFRVTALFLPLAVAAQEGRGSNKWEQRGQALVAGAVGLLYALGAEKSQHVDAGKAALAAQAEGRRRTGRTINPSITEFVFTNPL